MKKALIITGVASVLAVSAACAEAKKSPEEEREAATKRVRELMRSSTPPSTPEYAQRLRDISILEQKLPYKGNAYALLGSVGQQVKLCGLIVVGKVTNVERPVEITEKTPITLTLNIESNVFGRVASRNVRVSLQGGDADEAEKAICRKGERFLVFLSQTDYDVETFLEKGRLDFDISVKKGKAVQSPVVFYGIRSLIKLADSESEREVLAAVSGYLDCLRRGPRDAGRYYAMLREFVRSPVERIRDDARSDMRLIFYCPGIKEKAVLDEKLDDGIRDYARYLLKPQKMPGGEETR
jgi:hypothetical protein